MEKLCSSWSNATSSRCNLVMTIRGVNFDFVSSAYERVFLLAIIRLAKMRDKSKKSNYVKFIKSLMRRISPFMSVKQNLLTLHFIGSSLQQHRRRKSGKVETSVVLCLERWWATGRVSCHLWPVSGYKSHSRPLLHAGYRGKPTGKNLFSYFIVVCRFSLRPAVRILQSRIYSFLAI